MPHVTVYVSEELNSRMDGVGQGLNWSAVAQRTFGEAVFNHAARKDDATMDDVVERLRASKKRVEEDAFEEGKTSGRDWAEASAEFDELERVVKGDLGGNDDQLASLKRLIDPTDEADAYFWEKFLPQGHEQESAGNNAFAQGFVAGAIAVYREVIGRL